MVITEAVWPWPPMSILILRNRLYDLLVRQRGKTVTQKFLRDWRKQLETTDMTTMGIWGGDLAIKKLKARNLFSVARFDLPADPNVRWPITRTVNELSSAIGVYKTRNATFNEINEREPSHIQLLQNASDILRRLLSAELQVSAESRKAIRKCQRLIQMELRERKDEWDNEIWYPGFVMYREEFRALVGLYASRKFRGVPQKTSQIDSFFQRHVGFLLMAHFLRYGNRKRRIDLEMLSRLVHLIYVAARLLQPTPSGKWKSRHTGQVIETQTIRQNLKRVGIDKVLQKGNLRNLQRIAESRSADS